MNEFINSFINSSAKTSVYLLSFNSVSLCLLLGCLLVDFCFTESRKKLMGSRDIELDGYPAGH